MSAPLLEVCVDTIEGARIAAQNGADRIELCASLAEGGLTPSTGFQKYASKLDVPVYVMLRPRGGSFIYSDDEKNAILEDARTVRQNGAKGIVVGAITTNHTLDTVFLKNVVEIAGLPATLHRAFDTAKDPFKALEEAIDLGFERILTSGQQPVAAKGTELMRDLVSAARGRISIMPGTGITPDNAAQIINETTADEIHSSCSTLRQPADLRDSNVILGFIRAGGEKLTDARLVQEMKSAISQISRIAS